MDMTLPHAAHQPKCLIGRNMGYIFDKSVESHLKDCVNTNPTPPNRLLEKVIDSGHKFIMFLYEPKLTFSPGMEGYFFGGYDVDGDTHVNKITMLVNYPSWYHIDTPGVPHIHSDGNYVYFRNTVGKETMVLAAQHFCVEEVERFFGKECGLKNYKIISTYHHTPNQKQLPGTFVDTFVPKPVMF